MTRPNRNELCPCGSGKKNKKCCGAAQPTPLSRGALLSLAPLALLAGIGIYAAITGPAAPEPAGAAPSATPAAAPLAAPANADSAPPAGSQQPVPQAGTAPAGKVWSPEHGHWHDAAAPSGGPSPVKIDLNMGNAAVKAEGDGIRIDGRAIAAAAGEMRLPGQPDGPAPAGKVWSTEHQHWHDKPTAPLETVHLGTVNYPSEPVPQPGPAPAGTVWSPEHGHWHRAGPAPAAPATTATQPQ